MDSRRSPQSSGQGIPLAGHPGRQCFKILLGGAILLSLACGSSNQGGTPPAKTGGADAGGTPTTGGTPATGGERTQGNTGGATTGTGGTVATGGRGGGTGGSPELDAGTTTPTQGGVVSQGGSAGGNTPADASITGGSPSTGGAPAGTGGALKQDAGPPDTQLAPDTAAVVGNPRRFIVCDEGNQRVRLIDLDKTTTGWKRDLPGLRDIQLIGDNLLGVSIPEGYVELDLDTGAIKKEVKAFANVQSFRRLPNGNTILGMEANGTTLQELDGKDVPVAGRKVSFSALTNFRLFRRTPQDTFLVGAGNKLAEVNWDKETVWEMTFPGTNLYVYQGLRLPDGNLAVSQGYGASLMIVEPVAKKILTTIGGKQQPEAAAIQPNFYAGFQILPNGHFVVTNWEGHGGGNGGKGIQLLEYDGTGKMVWKWQQDPSLVSSLHHVLVLDGLDTSRLHDDLNGVLAPVAP